MKISSIHGAVRLKRPRARCTGIITITTIAIGFALALMGVESFAWPKTVGNVLAVSGWLLILGLFIGVWMIANRAAQSAGD